MGNNDTTGGGAGSAAPAPAADAATGERTQAPDWRARALEAEARFDSADAELGRTYRDLDLASLHQQRAEAERDRLSAELAAVRGRTGAQAVADLMARVAKLENRAMAAEAEAARWRAQAMERESEHAAALIRAIRAETEVMAGRELRRAALDVYEQIPVTTAAEHMWRAMEAYDESALATTTPTPPAAEAVTGFGRWIGPEEDRVTRLLIHAAMAECDDEWGANPSDELIAVAAEYRAWEYEQPEPDQDQPQEADHAQ